MKTRRDIEQARARMSPSIGYWRDIGAVAKLLERGETVSRLAGGQQDHHRGVLVLTDSRLLFVSERQVLWAIRRGEIESMRCVCSDLFGTITVQAHGRVLEMRFVDRKDAVALVTAAGGTWRRVQQEVEIAS